MTIKQRYDDFARGYDLATLAFSGKATAQDFNFTVVREGEYIPGMPQNGLQQGMHLEPMPGVHPDFHPYQRKQNAAHAQYKNTHAPKMHPNMQLNLSPEELLELLARQANYKRPRPGF